MTNHGCSHGAPREDAVPGEEALHTPMELEFNVWILLYYFGEPPLDGPLINIFADDDAGDHGCPFRLVCLDDLIARPKSHSGIRKRKRNT